MYRKCIIGLGSNFGKKENMAKAKAMLAERFPGVRFGQTIETEPEGMENDMTFFNSIAEISTDMEEPELKSALKHIEALVGRTADEKKKGIIRIDIDLIACGGNILKQKDLDREYMKYLVRTL